MIKRICVFFTTVILLLSSCGYIAYKDYYDETDYENIWNLPGFNHGYDGVSAFFPQQIEALEILEFFCRYDQQLPLGEGLQILLKVYYGDEEAFLKEVERVSLQSTNSSDQFPQTEFLAYSTRLGEKYGSEYALIDMDQKIVYYVYLQNLPKSEIEFSHHLLPKGYTDYGEIK
ncbi:MAG: hypothetical protein IJX13_04710 [Clostridia bacterium]|nr:hypothetical protein [Clostridia bacterium]